MSTTNNNQAMNEAIRRLFAVICTDLKSPRGCVNHY